jgi:hypothetical protein
VSEWVQLKTTGPTYIVFLYLFPDDALQVSYVSGSHEWVAWTVPWSDIQARETRHGQYQLQRKTDMALMLGVDCDQWEDLNRVRSHALVSRRMGALPGCHAESSREFSGFSSQYFSTAQGNQLMRSRQRGTAYHLDCESSSQALALSRSSLAASDPGRVALPVGMHEIASIPPAVKAQWQRLASREISRGSERDCLNSGQQARHGVHIHDAGLPRAQNLQASAIDALLGITRLQMFTAVNKGPGIPDWYMEAMNGKAQGGRAMPRGRPRPATTGVRPSNEAQLERWDYLQHIAGQWQGATDRGFRGLT